MDGQRLRDQIRRYIETVDLKNPSFGPGSDLVELGRYQYHNNAVFKRYCDSLGAKLDQWDDIPPVPAQFFKRFDMACYTHHADEKLWFSSGTSQTGASKTPLANTKIYDTVIKRLWPVFDNKTMRLIPTGKKWPNSSLSHFFDIGEKWEGTKWYDGLKHINQSKFDIDYEAVFGFCANYQASSDPVRLVGTSYALAQVFDTMEEKNLEFLLPIGSQIIDTGGYKGIVEDRSRDKFQGQAIERLGIHPQLCLNEYGMSEMSSHFWSTWVPSEPLFYEGEEVDVGIDEWWKVPPWVKVKIVNPMTLQEDPDGVAAFWDLANVWSVCAILTQDHGIVRTTSTGQQLFRPLGRAKGAEAKGCSLAAERAMEKIQ